MTKMDINQLLFITNDSNAQSVCMVVYYIYVYFPFFKQNK